MPTLDWIGKHAVVNHHRQVPYRLLQTDEKLSAGDPDAGNLLVQGDNLEALKALLPYYAGQVKCIYIDPPYNTGNEGWVYNDNVNSPEIRKWLDKTVGKEAEDLSRHDKWLCMMYPRLCLLREFMREDGAIFVSIDDNEVHNLRSLMDEIFGGRNHVACLTWQKRVSPANDAKHFSSDHEYVLVYARNITKWFPNRLQRTEKQLKNYSNPDNDPRGPWNSVTYTCNKSADERPNLFHPITNPNTGDKILPRKTAVWKYDRNTYQKHVNENRIWWGVNGTAKMPRLKRFLSETKGVVPRSILPYSDYGSTQEARTEILKIIKDNPFTTPKPVRLIQKLLEISTDKDSIVLDSFAGSATTGHAVMSLNQSDNGSRRFVLIEMDKVVCQEVSAQRLKNVIDSNLIPKVNTDSHQDALNRNSFQYTILGTSLFDEHGNIASEVRFVDLARHVYFTETGVPIPKQPRKNCPLLGVYQGTAFYLLYNGVLGDKRPDGGNVLTSKVLADLPDHPDGDGPKVIYGEACRIGAAKLKALGIEFKQLPYQIKTD